MFWQTESLGDLLFSFIRGLFVKLSHCGMTSLGYLKQPWSDALESYFFVHVDATRQQECVI